MKKFLIILSMLLLPLMACTTSHTQSPILTTAKFMSCETKEFTDITQKQTCLINLAKKNNLNAQEILAMAYKVNTPYHFKKDETQYLYWQKKQTNNTIALAKKGDGYAQQILGEYYEHGTTPNIKQDHRQALYWYNQALNTLKSLANEGNASAQLYLSHMYLVGEGVEKNQEKGLEWLMKSAKQNNTKAQVVLAIIYINQSHDKTNLVKAYAWSSIAKHNISTQFNKKLLDSAISHMNADQKKQGEELRKELLKTIKNK